MTDTFRATHKVIGPSRNLGHHTFEIFGFDFMLDEDFKVYLIEVNTNFFSFFKSSPADGENN